MWVIDTLRGGCRRLLATATNIEHPLEGDTSPGVDPAIIETGTKPAQREQSTVDALLRGTITVRLTQDDCSEKA